MSQHSEFYAFMCEDTFLRKMIVHMINNRIQEFSDPLTSTLVLLATTPMQMVFCESGFILFKTALLPILPYHTLSTVERHAFGQWVQASSNEHESCDSSGQFTLSIPLLPKQPNLFLCKRALLTNFVHVMQHHNGTFNDPVICSTLCNIIIQRFLAIVPVPSDVVSFIMAQLKTTTQPTDQERADVCPLLLQPSDSRYQPVVVEAVVVVVPVVEDKKRKRKKHQVTDEGAAVYKKPKEPQPV